MFSKLKDWRRISKCYDRCAHTFFSAINIAAIIYGGYLATFGMRDDIPYIRAGQVSAAPLPLKPGATVAIIGDWGTGTAEATALLGQVASHNPDVLIHLGGIYYSGTPAEC